MMIGVYSWDIGNLVTAKNAFIEAAAIGKASENKRVAVTSTMYLGHAMELEGKLHQAVEIYQAAFQFVEQEGRELPLAGYPHVELARVLYELNELESSRQHLKLGIAFCELLSDKRVENMGYCLLAQLYLAQRNITEAANAIQKSEQFSPSPEIVYDMRGVEYPKVRLWLKQNNLKEIENWLNENKPRSDNGTNFKSRLTYTMQARVMIALGREAPKGATHLQDALEILEKLLEMAESNGWWKRVVEILALRALAFDASEEPTKSLAELERALTLAEPEGYVRTFLDEGPLMAHLLYEALSRNITPDYVQQLLAAFPVDEPEKSGLTQPRGSDPELIEQLSEREIEVLQLIAQGLSNREVGERLYLTLNTVKAHSRTIYSKLGVNNRTQAVAKARALGIISNH